LKLTRIGETDQS